MKIYTIENGDTLKAEQHKFIFSNCPACKDTMLLFFLTENNTKIYFAFDKQNIDSIMLSYGSNISRCCGKSVWLNTFYYNGSFRKDTIDFNTYSIFK